MILTVTINPLLEQRLTYKKIFESKQNRNGELVFAAGGKGINVSRQLNKLGIENIALTFAGGLHGKHFRNSLNKENINFVLINTQSESRVCTVAIDLSSKKSTSYFSENQQITNEEVELFISKMDKMIQNCEMVIFSGSSPCTEAELIFPSGIELAKKYNKVSFCDTYGRHLTECLSAEPVVVHNNIDEVEKSLGIPLVTRKEILDYLDQLYQKNIKQIYLTNGPEKSYASNFDFHYEVNVPKITSIDSTGSGDSFVAGIAYGWHKSMFFANQLKLGTALGTVNASSFNVSNVDLQDAQKLIDEIEILSIGKKIKTIDDTPN